jgi:hypothetical protein
MDEALIKDLLKGSPMIELNTQDTSAKVKEQMVFRGPIPGMMLAKEKPVVLTPSSQKPEHLTMFQQQRTTTKPKEAESLASTPTTIKQKPTNAEKAERKNCFKQEMMELARIRRLKQQKRVAQDQVPKEGPGLLNIMKQMTLSHSSYPQQKISTLNTNPTLQFPPTFQQVSWTKTQTTVAGPPPQTPTNSLPSSDPNQLSMKMVQTAPAALASPIDSPAKMESQLAEATFETTLATSKPAQNNTTMQSPMIKFGNDMPIERKFKPEIAQPSPYKPFYIGKVEFLTSNSYGDADYEDEEEF